MPHCQRNLEDHCCYLKGKTCPFLRDDGLNVEFRWVCTLREELGNWDTVHNDERYKTLVQPILIELNIRDCGEYTCENCID